MKKTPESPCHDCKYRHGGCQTKCVLWADYVEERDRVYEENRKEQLLVAGYAEHVNRNLDRAEKRKRRGIK